MMICLSDEQLERLSTGRVVRWRAWLWRRHVRMCLRCRSCLENAGKDNKLVEDVRLAVQKSPQSHHAI